MKALPCRTPGCAGHLQLRGTAVLKDGSPYLIGCSPAHFPYQIHCSACKRKTAISQTEWNALPTLSSEDLSHVQGPSDDPTSHQDFRVVTRTLLGR